MRHRIARPIALVAAMLAGVLVLPADVASARHGGRVNLFGATYSVQNYFDGGALGSGRIPFFEQLAGRVGPRVEVPQSAGYIYSIDISKQAIAMTWNTDPTWDAFEPHVGAGLGLSPDAAAGLGIADQYEITFSRSIGRLRVWADPHQPIVPDVTIVDDHTVVISLPGGTQIGDGRGAVIRFSQDS